MSFNHFSKENVMHLNSQTCGQITIPECSLVCEDVDANKRNSGILDYLVEEEYSNDSDLTANSSNKFDDREYVNESSSFINSDEKPEQQNECQNVHIYRKEIKVKETRFDEKSFNVKKTSDKKDESVNISSALITFILFAINLLNFIDRFTLAGVLKEVQDYFKIDDKSCGLLQTVFICSYMLLAPLFGYLGDRYPRKWIIVFGVSFWSLTTLLGAFVPKNQFMLFVILRSLVGIGEASYSCLAPTIIGDLFTGAMRTKCLAIFYLAVPLGSGLGYIIGSNIAKAFNDWRWSLCFTPPLSFICIILLAIFVKEPKRGGAEGSAHHEENTSSILSDTIYLLKNKTFVWITIGFTFASFVLGGLSWWIPTYVQYAIYSKNQVPEQIPLIFGVCTCISGLIGVTASSLAAPKLRAMRAYADPIICAIGSLIAVPTLFVIVMITRTSNQILFWFITSIGISAMCLSWTMIADILLYVIHPNKRSIASALNILIVHLFGDSGSPYIIGTISDYLRANKPDTYFNRFSSLQTALYAGPFFAALSFAAYLFAAVYVEADKKTVDEYIKKKSQLSNFEMNGKITLNSQDKDKAFQKSDSGIGSLYISETLMINKGDVKYDKNLISEILMRNDLSSNLLLEDKFSKVEEINENDSMSSKFSSSLSSLSSSSSGCYEQTKL